MRLPVSVLPSYPRASTDATSMEAVVAVVRRGLSQFRLCRVLCAVRRGSVRGRRDAVRRERKGSNGCRAACDTDERVMGAGSEKAWQVGQLLSHARGVV